MVRYPRYVEAFIFTVYDTIMNLSLLSENDLQIHLVKLVVMHVCRYTATCVSHDYYFQYIFTNYFRKVY